MTRLLTALWIFIFCLYCREQKQDVRERPEKEPVELGKIHDINLNSRTGLIDLFSKWEPPSHHFMARTRQWDKADCKTRKVFTGRGADVFLLQCDLDSGMGFYWSRLLTWTLFEYIEHNRYRLIFHFSRPSKRPPTLKFIDMETDGIPEIWMDIPAYTGTTRAIYKLQSSGYFTRIFTIPTQFGRRDDSVVHCFGYKSNLRFSKRKRGMPDIIMKVRPWANPAPGCRIAAESTRESIRIRNAVLSEVRGIHRFRYGKSRYTPISRGKVRPGAWLETHCDKYSPSILPE